jgi:energy-coupling factor transport system ATP-binding protein
MIEVTDLTFQYPESEGMFALRGVSFTLKPGERVAVMGANGSGKTTLALCLNGLLKPVSGHVVVDGLHAVDSGSLYEIRRRVGMVFQNPDNQIVTTTVLREIAFGLENMGVPTADMRSRVEDAVTLFGLGEYRHAPPHLLSGGERQRLALASVWVMQPDYLVLDEPTSLLDPKGRQDIFRFLDEDNVRNRKGVLLVTQFPDEALMCDRLLVMDGGTVVFDDSPLAVFHHQDDLRRLGLEIPVKVELSNYMT